MSPAAKTRPFLGRTSVPPLAVLLFSIAIAGVLFLALAFAASGHASLPGDLAVARAVQSFDLPGLATCMYFFSYVGAGVPAVLMTAGIALGLYRTASARDAAFVIATLLARLPHRLVKEIVRRPRPSADVVNVLLPADGFGFPSGHAAGAVIFFGFLAWLVWLRVRRPLVRIAALTGCGTFILLIGLSRVYVGAHWPSDVLGGYAFGAIVLALLIAVHGGLEARSRSARDPESIAQ